MLLTGLVDNCTLHVDLFPQACACQEMSINNYYCAKISNNIIVNTTDNSIACVGQSFLWRDIENQKQDTFSTGCFYPESSDSPSRVDFILVTTTTLSIITVSLEAENFNGLHVCNATKFNDFNVLFNGKCISARGLADLMRSRPGCSNSENIHVANNDSLMEHYSLQFQLTPNELTDCRSKSLIQSLMQYLLYNQILCFR